MDRKKMLQVLLPAGAAGGMVLLVGLLIALGDGGSSDATVKGKDGKPAAVVDDSGMSDSVPPLDAPEWKEQASGLKVWDVTEGEGTPVPPGARVLVHYSGWLPDGKPFDSSRKRGQPIDFSLDGVIRGWTLGIPGMKPGGVRRLYIPAELAYGANPDPRSGIPPNSPLVFEVKLLKVL